MDAAESAVVVVTAVRRQAGIQRRTGNGGWVSFPDSAGGRYWRRRDWWNDTLSHQCYRKRPPFLLHMLRCCMAWCGCLNFLLLSFGLPLATVFATVLLYTFLFDCRPALLAILLSGILFTLLFISIVRPACTPPSHPTNLFSTLLQGGAAK